MGMLDEPLGAVRVPDPDPETITRRRLELNKRLGIYRPPAQHELEFYAREGKPPPAE